MRTIWRSLLWKEWHEHKWKMLSLVAIAVSIPLASLFDGPDTFFLSITSTLYASAILSALFIGMGVAAGENANKTMPFLQALPVPMWKAGATKFLLAGVTVILPILIVIGLTFLGHQLGGWLGYNFKSMLNLISRNGVEGWYTFHLTSGILAALSLLMWVVASGVNRRDEIRAGAISVLVFVCIWSLIFFAISRGGQSINPYLWLQIAVATAPAGPGIIYVNQHTAEFNSLPGWTLALFACVGHAGLMAWFLCRFGRTSSTTRESRRAAFNTGQQLLWLAPPRHFRLTAILWKQMRETGSFVMLGVAVIVGCSMLIYLLSEEPRINGTFSQILLGMCGYLGFFIVIVAGIGVLLDDLKPGLHTFWRSRPINPDLWFWTKFLTGLTTTAIALGIPLLLALWFMPGNFWDIYHERLIITPALFLSIYCFAVVAMALVRRPVYAAIIAIGLIASCFFTIERLLPKSFEFHAGAVCVMAMVLPFLATLTAWLAVRYDIGYKG
ncbi:MAG: hypothetical protein ABGX16_22545 [Pirellulales bacterium]